MGPLGCPAFWWAWDLPSCKHCKHCHRFVEKLMKSHHLWIISLQKPWVFMGFPVSHRFSTGFHGFFHHFFSMFSLGNSQTHRWPGARRRFKVDPEMEAQQRVAARARDEAWWFSGRYWGYLIWLIVVDNDNQWLIYIYWLVVWNMVYRVMDGLL
jgi:hypothetical protein